MRKIKNPSHREMMYDPIESTRGFKKMMLSHCSPVEGAFYRGEFYGMTRPNPYPKGLRHDEYARGQKLHACL